MTTSGKATAPILETLEVEAQAAPGAAADRSSFWRFCAMLVVCALCGAGAWHLTSSYPDTAALTQLYAYIPSMPVHHTVKSPAQKPSMPTVRPGHLRNPVSPMAHIVSADQTWSHRMGTLENDCLAGIVPACDALAEEEAAQAAWNAGHGAPAWDPIVSGEPGWSQHMQALADDCQLGVAEACVMLAEEEQGAEFAA